MGRTARNIIVDILCHYSRAKCECFDESKSFFFLELVKRLTAKKRTSKFHYIVIIGFTNKSSISECRNDSLVIFQCIEIIEGENFHEIFRELLDVVTKGAISQTINTSTCKPFTIQIKLFESWDVKTAQNDIKYSSDDIDRNTTASSIISLDDFEERFSILIDEKKIKRFMMIEKDVMDSSSNIEENIENRTIVESFPMKSFENLEV